ncbi:vWA domain-containing protein [Actinoplanes sp. NPDC023801]|uniref:vWA domain-containing protein n=1 Tax=Actinoplanes sp. NPDC023801 TaxID=3154595 RepID=UPI0033FA3A96
MRRPMTLMALAAVSVPLVLLPGPAPGLAREDPPSLPPMQVVVLVDESGSLSDDDVVREREAARTIAFSVLAPQSEISVVGFGSSNAPGQSAVNVVCKPAVLATEQDRDALAECISGLHRRKPEEGADTDHAAALKQALSIVRAGDAGHKKVVFLLTDGVLDVRASTNYGDNPDRRNAAAKAEAQRTLDQLAAAKAQVWPLGFGAADQAALKGFARGKSCAAGAGDPRDRVVSDSSELTEAVAEAFSSAGCVKYRPIAPQDLDRGSPLDLRGTIPAVASEASIIVYKRDKRVQVEYLAPGARRPAPEEGGSNIQIAGQATEVETIRISDPVPGEWTIRLSSAAVSVKDVEATVVYQAAVRTYLTVNPPQPVAGQEVDVEMQVWARNRAITDAAELSTLTFAATMSGSGGRQKIPLTDPDADGTFSGKVTVPERATGDLTFTGQVTGIGIGGDTRVLNTLLQSAGKVVQGSIRFDVNRATAHPGGEITGQITVRNDSGEPARLRIVVADPTPGADFSIDPAVVDAAPGTTRTPFALKLGGRAAEGTASATVRLVDDATSAVAAERLVAVQVVPEPTFVTRYRWWILAAGVLLVIGLAYLAVRLRARYEAKKVRGLIVRLHATGMTGEEIVGGDSMVLRFTVGTDFSGPNLQPAGARDPEAWEVRRSGTGTVVNGPGSPRAPLAFGARRRVGEGLAIVITDGGTAETADDHADTDRYDPFQGAPSSMPVPGQRAEDETTRYAAASDPFGGGPEPDPFRAADPDPFGAPADPFADFHTTDPGNPFR